MKKNKTIILISATITALIMIIIFLLFLLFQKDSENILIKGKITSLTGTTVEVKSDSKKYQITDNDISKYNVGDEVEFKASKKELKDNIIPTSKTNIVVTKKYQSPIVEESIITENKAINSQVNDKTNYTETDVVNYLANQVKNVEVSTKLTDSIKSGFIKVVDFLFYDGEILNHKFKDLTNETKIIVMELAFKLDGTIAKKFPNYKEIIGDKAIKLKDEFVKMYLDFGTMICESDAKLCVNVKSSFQNIKNYADIGWDTIKNLASSSIDKLRNWYEIFSGK